VIGYGNTLRGDDGIGPYVAETVAGWQRPGVRSLAVQQLTPELAEPLANAGLAIFVDVRSASEDDAVRLQCLAPVEATFTLGHASDPQYLLRLARTLYGRSPPAWWVLVPGTSYALREGLSAVAARGMETALHEIGLLIDRHADSCTKSA
jgi:hydrogenase maturation protease